jgi:hypothetical protein
MERYSTQAFNHARAKDEVSVEETSGGARRGGPVTTLKIGERFLPGTVPCAGESSCWHCPMSIEGHTHGTTRFSAGLKLERLLRACSSISWTPFAHLTHPSSPPASRHAQCTPAQAAQGSRPYSYCPVPVAQSDQPTHARETEERKSRPVIFRI